MPANWRPLERSIPTSTPGVAFTFLHWGDLPLADAWFAEAFAITNTGPDRKWTRAQTIEKWDTIPYREQLAIVRSAWNALSNGYRAANVPPVTDPMYLRVWELWWGAVRSLNEPARPTKARQPTFPERTRIQRGGRRELQIGSCLSTTSFAMFRPAVRRPGA
jgi:hypothetical protein